MKLEQRTFIVSGGSVTHPRRTAASSDSKYFSSSSGLGLAASKLLLSQGAYVSILDIRPPPSSKESESSTPVTAEPSSFEIPHPRINFIETDITSLASVTSAVAATIAWSEQVHAPLGGVINCAGVATAAKTIDARGAPHDIGLWDWTLAVNLTGTFNLTRLALEHLVKVNPENDDGERGVVIFVSSAAAVRPSLRCVPPNDLILLISSKVSPARLPMLPQRAHCAP